ncbi:BppU family phage baseplate upper protein [Ureibacillus chungkukjangi]|uniref:glycosyl hydrolase family 28-related protein n=1 Tax=Ureibacillus chungkukjangi TaxID=1202712 RepID=UPI00204051F3|nr:glycosyl hydrolase family 28-related protein [Ureibacillus chungkukjangi]MCM3387352.1 BppU family phage baseplate upper protein [Ureibacillus chungkukjangi]
MAFANEYILNVDLKKTISNNVPTFKQGDTAILKFKIFDNGKAYDLSSFTDAEITFRIPSGDVVIGNPVLEDGMIVYRLQGAEMTRVGNVSTILTIRSGNDEVSIQPFRIFIYDSMKTENLTYIGALQELIEATQEIEVNSYTIITEMNETRVALETDANTYKETLVQDVTEYKSEVNTFNSNRVHKKNWNVATQYVTNNEVEFNGSTWRALRNNKGVTPAEGLDWTLIARKGDDGLGTVNRIREVFIATEGQRDFNLQQTYDQYQNRIDVTVMGVPQFSPDNFTELTNKSIRLSEGVPAGTEVIVVYYTHSIPMASDIQTTVNNHTTKLNNHEVRVSETETNVTSLTAQLAEKATNVKTFGAKGDGTTNDTTAILNCFQYCISNNTLAYFPTGTYVFKPTSSFNCNGMIGQKAALDYDSSIPFTLRDNSIIRGIDILYNNPASLNTRRIFDITSIKNVVVEDCKFTYKTDSGALGSRVFRIDSSSNIQFKNIIFKNSAYGFYVLKSSFLNFKNIEFHNFSGGITVSDNIYSEADWSHNIYIDNVIAKNTKVERANALSASTGHNVLLAFYGAKDVQITNVLSEYALRRVFYCSTGKNMSLNNVRTKGTSSIKFSGTSQIQSDGFSCSNVQANWDTDISDRATFDFYFAKNITVNQVNVTGSNNLYTVALQNQLENFTMSNAFFDGGRIFCLMELMETRAGDPEQNIADQHYSTYNAIFKNVLFRNISVKNHSGSTGFVFNTLNNIPDNDKRFQDILLMSVTVDNANGAHKGTVVSPTYLCRGLLDIDKVSGLRVEGCSIDGYTNERLRSIVVRSNSEKVRVIHKDFIETDNNVTLTDIRNLFLSSGSNYVIQAKVKATDKPVVYLNYSIKPNISSESVTANSMLNFSVEGELSYKMLETITGGINVLIVPYTETWYTNDGLTRPHLLGTMEVFATDGDWGQLRVNSQTTPNIIIPPDAINIKNDYSTGVFTVVVPSAGNFELRDRDIVNRTVRVTFKLQTVA